MSITSKHVSKRLKAEATASIEAKCRQLEVWSKRGLPSYVVSPSGEGPSHTTVEWFPTSIRAFCAWDGSQNTPALRTQLSKLKRNAFKTVKSDAGTCLKVLALIKNLKQQAKLIQQNADPSWRAKEIEKAAIHERQKRHGALLGYRAARRQVRELDAALAKEKRAHQETIKQLERQIEEKGEEIVELHDRVARLTTDLKKVAPIRRVR